jgi:hypothetical protein
LRGRRLRPAVVLIAALPVLPVAHSGQIYHALTSRERPDVRCRTTGFRLSPE